jgi:ornithine cyclodeaminase/alanine dehydrogenase-like protein (mu-crystallin family)
MYDQTVMQQKVMRVLFDHSRHQFPVTEAVLRATAANAGNVDEVMSLLLNKRGDDFFDKRGRCRWCRGKPWQRVQHNTAFPRQIRRKLAGMCEGVGPIRESNRVHIL